MAIHIGELIQKEVEAKRLTYKEFGTLIHRNEKTIPDIYDRATMSIDLLITISGALKKDFLHMFYTEEPMKSLREDKTIEYQHQINAMIEQLRVLTDKSEYLTKELTGKQELIDILKGYNLLANKGWKILRRRSGKGHLNKVAYSRVYYIRTTDYIGAYFWGVPYYRLSRYVLTNAPRGGKDKGK